MIKNKDLLSKKKFIKAAALISMPAIELTEEEADKFIDYVIDESKWDKNARIVKMSKPEKIIRYAGFAAGGTFLHPAATFTAAEYTKEFAHDKITLASKKCRGALVVYDDDLEDGIEGPAFADHLMKIVAKKIANELDVAYWVSQEDFAATEIRSLWEGWRYQLINNAVMAETATILDASNTMAGHGTDFIDDGSIAEKNAVTNIWQFKYGKMLAKLPSKYKVDGLSNLRYFQNDVVTSDYIEALSDRSTVLGDNAILGQAALSYGTVPIVSIPGMPITYVATDDVNDGKEDYEAGAGGNIYTDCVLTHKENFIIGLQRYLKMETKRAPEDEGTYFFYSIRADLAIENPNAAVICLNLTHS